MMEFYYAVCNQLSNFNTHFGIIGRLWLEKQTTWN